MTTLENARQEAAAGIAALAAAANWSIASSRTSKDGDGDMIWIKNPLSPDRERFPRPVHSEAIEPPPASHVRPVTRPAVWSGTWRSFREEARDAGLTDADGTYLWPLPHPGDAGLVSLIEGTVTADETTATRWPSRRLLEAVSATVPTHGAIEEPDHDLAGLAARVDAASAAVRTLLPLPHLGALPSVDVRELVEAYAVDLVARAFYLPTPSALSVLASIGVFVSADLVAEHRAGGYFAADELGAPVAEAVAEQARLDADLVRMTAKDTEDYAARQAAQEAEDARTTPVSGAELGCVFMHNATETEEHRFKIARHGGSAGNTVKVLSAQEAKLTAFSMAGLKYPACTLVKDNGKAILRVCDPDERWDLTAREIALARNAPMLAGPGALQAWKDERGDSGPITRTLTPKTAEWRAALFEASRLIALLAPVVSYASVSLPECICRGLLLPIDVAVHEITTWFTENDPTQANWRDPVFVLDLCATACRGGTVAPGELTPKAPGLIERIFEPHRDVVRELVKGREWVTSDEVIDALQKAGDRQAVSPQLYGRITKLLDNCGFEQGFHTPPPPAKRFRAYVRTEVVS